MRTSQVWLASAYVQMDSPKILNIEMNFSLELFTSEHDLGDGKLLARIC